MRLLPHQEQILVNTMKERAAESIAAGKLIMKLAKLETTGLPQTAMDLIIEARHFVLAHLAHQVGVRKLAREKWGMILVKQPHGRKQLEQD